MDYAVTTEGEEVLTGIDRRQFEDVGDQDRRGSGDRRIPDTGCAATG